MASLAPLLHQMLHPRFALSLTCSSSFSLLGSRHRPVLHRLFASSSQTSASLSSTSTTQDVEEEKQRLEVIDVNPPRGTRDFPPKMRLRNWFFQNFREVSRILAFEEVGFPVLES